MNSLRIRCAVVAELLRARCEASVANRLRSPSLPRNVEVRAGRWIATGASGRVSRTFFFYVALGTGSASSFESIPRSAKQKLLEAATRRP